MPARCFECQEVGHIAADCPTKFYAAEMGDGKQPWCGQCDRETRIVYSRRDGRDTAVRCPSCHPKSHMLPATYSRCKGCRQAVYAWDIRSECGQHQPVGQHLTPAQRGNASS